MAQVCSWSVAVVTIYDIWQMNDPSIFTHSNSGSGDVLHVQVKKSCFHSSYRQYFQKTRNMVAMNIPGGVLLCQYNKTILCEDMKRSKQLYVNAVARIGYSV
jgi:hypothetical protein